MCLVFTVTTLCVMVNMNCLMIMSMLILRNHDLKTTLVTFLKKFSLLFEYYFLFLLFQNKNSTHILLISGMTSLCFNNTCTFVTFGMSNREISFSE